MNQVERVRAICKERKIAISKLEKDLGFSNGYIAQLRKGIFPSDRLDLISEYLGVSTNYLIYGEEEKTPAVTADGGLHSTRYDELSNKNKQIIDQMIETLVKSQSDD